MRAYENFTDLDLEIMNAAYSNQAIVERNSKLYDKNLKLARKRVKRLAVLREACIDEIKRRKEEAAA